jgi:integrase
MVENWGRLLEKRLWGPDDPLFPATKVSLGESGHFENGGLDRNHWKDAAAIRKIFKESFEAAGLPYFNPHSFRSTLAILGEKICPTAEAFKAWSQNLGHAQVLTTFTSYGAVASSRQAEIMTSLVSKSASADGEPDATMIHRVIAHLQQKSRL